MRLGFWPAVYGNWIISTHPETCDASFASTKRATLLAAALLALRLFALWGAPVHS